MVERLAGAMRPLNLGDGVELYIETVGGPLREGTEDDLTPMGPPGAEDNLTPIGVFDPLSNLARAIETVSQKLRKAVATAEPTAFEVELSFGFKGEARLIPVLLTGEGEGAIKVTLKWEKGD